MARRLGIDGRDLRILQRAALLHDIGKLGVSNLILDKPDQLTADETTAVRMHTRHTAEILTRVPCFASLSGIAAAHHERLDGGGYHLGLRGAEITMASRVLAVADIAEALRASRPYRKGLSIDQTLSILYRDRNTGVDPVCFEVLGDVLAELPQESPASPARMVYALAEDYAQAS
jgi:HD-GYP domain-containing protein (c-di-GMP phosphodiesterase class II)